MEEYKDLTLDDCKQLIIEQAKEIQNLVQQIQDLKLSLAKCNDSIAMNQIHIGK